jgi:hypothetical protein
MTPKKDNRPQNFYAGLLFARIQPPKQLSNITRTKTRAEFEKGCGSESLVLHDVRADGLSAVDGVPASGQRAHRRIGAAGLHENLHDVSPALLAARVDQRMGVR